jgi:hypothetical protein
MIKYKVYWLIVVFSLTLSSIAQASLEGAWSSKGILNVTFSKPAHQPVSTASNLEEPWVFNADKTFTRGGLLTGTWKQKRGNPKLFEASYDLSVYAAHLTNFWAERGVTVSNVRILRSILQIQEVSNGLSGEELLKYKMDIMENGYVRTTTVIIRGSFFATNGAIENTALAGFFPTLLQGQSNAAASSFTMMQVAPPTSINFEFSAPPTATFNILEPAATATPIEPQ